jgi:hypothetical protein
VGGGLEGWEAKAVVPVRPDSELLCGALAVKHLERGLIEVAVREGWQGLMQQQQRTLRYFSQMEKRGGLQAAKRSCLWWGVLAAETFPVDEEHDLGLWMLPAVVTLVEPLLVRLLPLLLPLVVVVVVKAAIVVLVAFEQGLEGAKCPASAGSVSVAAAL